MTTTPAHIDVSAIDFDVLGVWMDAEGLPEGPFENARPVLGGTQNVMVAFERGGVPYVLRRPPLHVRAKSNEVLRREARVLAALEGTGVPAPRLVAAQTADEPVFYLMEPVDGFNATTGLPEPHASDPAMRQRMGLEAAVALAALGRVSPDVLPGFGRPEGFLERQVPRWTSELESYGRLEGYPGPEIPLLRETAEWLERNRPRAFTPGVMHGDYHVANLMFSHAGPVGGGDRRLGDVHDRRPAARPGLAGGHLAFVAAAGARPAGGRGAPRLLRRAVRARPVLGRLVRRDGLFQARHRAGGHPRARVRGQGAQGHR